MTVEPHIEQNSTLNTTKFMAPGVHFGECNNCVFHIYNKLEGTVLEIEHCLWEYYWPNNYHIPLLSSRHQGLPSGTFRVPVS